MRVVLSIIIGTLCFPPVSRAEIPQPPVLLLTAQENGTEPQTTFPCSGPIHGYITFPFKVSGKHVLEGIWRGPRGTVVKHSRDDVLVPAPGSRSADIWLRFTKEGGHLWNPMSVQASGDEERSLYDGPWIVKVVWDGRTIARSDFAIQCGSF